MLEHDGYTAVESTTDSSSVVPMCAQQPPDLLILDLHMPEPDGFEVLAQLKPWFEGRWFPVLVVTADVTTEAKQRALSDGRTRLPHEALRHGRGAAADQEPARGALPAARGAQAEPDARAARLRPHARPRRGAGRGAQPAGAGRRVPRRHDGRAHAARGAHVGADRARARAARRAGVADPPRRAAARRRQDRPARRHPAEARPAAPRSSARRCRRTCRSAARSSPAAARRC